MATSFQKISIGGGAALTLVLAIFIFWPTPKPVVAPIEQPTVQKIVYPEEKKIGSSVEGRDIQSFTYGTGKRHIAFVGGIHGGYEWNSVLLAYKFMDYLKDNPNIVPKNLSIVVIPNINPDAVYKVTRMEGRFLATDVSSDATLLSSARFNAHNVDLNRNFDCKWQPKSTWKSKIVNAGTKAFSEPETVAFKNFISEIKPSAVIFWHSQANAVYASQCENGILPETLDIMNEYGTASGYTTVKTFDAYATTGAADDWLSSQNIPAITVELKTHEAIEWDKNIVGIKAVISYYGKKI
jgi:g-D-glutamyl-meso-diaminopimelate peptidase